MRNVLAMVFMVWCSLAVCAQEVDKGGDASLVDQKIFALETGKILSDVEIQLLSPKEGRIEEILKALEDLMSTPHFAVLSQEAAAGNQERKTLLGELGQAKMLIKGLQREEDPDTVAFAMKSAQEYLTKVKDGCLPLEEIKREALAQRRAIVLGVLVLIVGGLLMGISVLLHVV